MKKNVSDSLTAFIERLGLQEGLSVFFTGKEYTPGPVVSQEIQSKIDIIAPDAYYTFNNIPLIRILQGRMKFTSRFGHSIMPLSSLFLRAKRFRSLTLFIMRKG